MDKAIDNSYQMTPQQYILNGAHPQATQGATAPQGGAQGTTQREGVQGGPRYRNQRIQPFIFQTLMSYYPLSPFTLPSHSN